MCLVSCEAFDVLLVQVVGELEGPGKVHVDHHEWCDGGEVGLVEGSLVGGKVALCSDSAEETTFQYECHDNSNVEDFFCSIYFANAGITAGVA